MVSVRTTEVSQSIVRPPEASIPASESPTRDQAPRATKHLRSVDPKAASAQNEAVAAASERMKAILAVSAAYTEGLREMQVAYIDLVHRSMELMQRATRDLIRCASPADVAEFQKEMLKDGMEQMFQGASKILEATNKVADDAIRPLKEQLRRAS